MSNFSEVLEELRQKKGISKQKLAADARLTSSYVSHLTLGSRENPSEETVMKLALALELDDEEKIRLFKEANLALPTSPDTTSSSPSLPSIAASRQAGKPITEDWDDIPSLPTLFGREDEVEELTRWILQDRCQMVIVSGSGGIGKTMLTTNLARDNADKFDYVFWRTLKDAPPFESILEQCLFFLSRQQSLSPHLRTDERIRLLLSYLKGHRCLLILDNLESVLQEKEHVGEYREGYEDYGKLINIIGSIEHQSCLLVTTRELPKGMTLLAGRTAPVRMYPLTGLKVNDGLKILEDKGLHWAGQARDAKELVLRYAGNPLALRVAAEFIREAFAGDIALFLTSSSMVFQDIQSVLEEQFERLSTLEQQVMYWLAIEREAMSPKDLQSDFASPPEVMSLTNALQSLWRRSLIETQQNAYILQPVILEFVTRKFVTRVIQEIESGSINLLESHALIKALVKDYVRDAQIRLILSPIAQQLDTTYGRGGCEEKLKAILYKLHEAPVPKPGYAAANVLSLLSHLKYDLSDYDFSNLYVWQAYLQAIPLHHVNFSHAHLENTVFTDTFTSILSVAFSPDSSLLVAGTENGDVRLWNASNGAPLRSYEGHTGRVRSVAFSPDGQTIVSGSEDYTLRLWSIDSDQCLYVLQGHTDRVRSVAISPDGTVIISGSDDGTVKIWDLQTKNLLKTLQGHTDRVRSVAFSPDGGSIASSGEDQTVRLWDAQSGQCLKIMTGHEKHVHAVTFSPDGRLLVSGGEDHTVRLWDVQSGQCLQTLKGHTNQVRSVAFHPGGHMIASSSDDTSIRLWDAQSSQPIKILEGHLHRVYSVAFNHDGSTVMSGSEDQTIRLWDILSGRSIKTLLGHIHQVRSVAFNPEGTLLASGGDDQQLRLWDVQSGQITKTLRDHTNGIRAVAFSPDGKKIASGSDDWTVRLWNAQTGRVFRVLRDHTDRVRTIAYSHDGTRLASGGEDHIVRIWDTQSGQRLKVFQGHTDWVRSVAFSPDDTLLVSGGEDYTVRVWSVKSGKCLHVLQDHKNGVRCVAFSPDGSMLASSGDDETIRLWDTTTWEPFRTLQGDEHIRLHWIISIAFSPDGLLLASGAEDPVVRLWDVRSGKCLRAMPGHEHRVYSVAFHPDGHRLASGSLDGTIKFWDVGTGECINTLRSNKPYEGMDITETEGLTETQRALLKTLGAVEEV